MRRSTTLCAAGLAVCVMMRAALAQPPHHDLNACVTESDSAKRLACYDRQMGRPASPPAPTLAPAPASAPAPAAAPAPVAAPAPIATAPAPAAGAAPAPAPANAAPSRHETAEPLVAQVAKVLQLEPYVIAVVLDNGQIWKQTDSEGNLYIEPHETVTIRHAALGSFLMTTAHRRTLRVVRIR